MKQTAVRKNKIGAALTGLFLILVAGLSLAAILGPQFLASRAPDINLGQVAERDILADRAISFPSNILTEQKQNEAASAVKDIYSLPDTNIARQQLDHLKDALAFITSVRTDPHATIEDKLRDLEALDDMRISEDLAGTILAMSEARWVAVEQEAVAVLEELMRSPIQPANLGQSINTVPAMISLALSPTQASVISEFVTAFLAPNSFLSEDLTEAAREEARNSVDPVMRTFASGQTIIRRGEVFEPVDIEALEQFGFAAPDIGWQEYAAALALVTLMGGFMMLYLRGNSDIKEHLRDLVLISLLLLVFLFVARLTIYNHVVLPYLYPVAGYSMLVAALFGVRVAMISSLPLAVMIAYGMPNSLDLTIYYILGSLFGILVIGKARRISAFFLAGAAVAFAGMLVILAYRLDMPAMDWIGILTLFGASLANGLASAVIALLLQTILAFLIGTTTPMQLMDLTRPDQPLLQLILQNVPGTYQHSLQVSNLAEQAAERIGADPLLTRVGALYHDAGKALNPAFFIENQPPGFSNPHEELDPVDSARIIIQHVPDGVKLAQQYRIPRRIHDFVLEHHGTTMTRYQYAMAIAAAGGDESRVNEADFHYSGPRPQSRETAILMLADACEARIRAERPQDEETIYTAIKQSINQRISEGELNDTDLTLQDIEAIAESFTITLRGIYHPRIQYPKPALPEPKESTQLLPISIQEDETVEIAQSSRGRSPGAKNSQMEDTSPQSLGK